MSEERKPVHRHLATAQERLSRRLARREAVAARIRQWTADNAPAPPQAPPMPPTEVPPS